MHKTTTRFWSCFEALPEAVRSSARRSFDLLKADPSHPSIRFKKVGRLWSARVDRNHRALAVQDGEDFIWVWIGSHDDYERMIKRTQ